MEAIEPLKLEIKHFLDCVDNDFEPIANGYDGLKVVRAVEAAENHLKMMERLSKLMKSSDNRIIIYRNVSIGFNANISPFVILGKPPLGKNEGDLEVVIGNNATIRAFTTIYAGNKIGNNFSTGQNVSIREGNLIANNVSIGTSSVLEFDNTIGDNSRIHSGCFLEMVTVGKNVFIGPNVVFTDDPHPMKCPHYKECRGGVIVEDLVKIGANTTILPGIKIGKIH